MLRTVTLQLRPTARQRLKLNRILAFSCDLYNAAVQERRDAWQLRHISITLYDQIKSLTAIRLDDSEIRGISVDVMREPLRRVDRAFKAFFRRCKTGQKPGFPRFRAKPRYDSFTFHLPRIHGETIMVPTFGGLRFKRPAREIKGALRTATIKRCGNKWKARIVADIGPATQKRAISTAIGIDLGLTQFITLSDGTAVQNPRWTQQYDQRIAKANQLLALKKHGSRNRAKAKEALRRVYQKAANARRNFTHHISKSLVSNYDFIAFEKLNIRGMVRSNLAKPILDAAWGELIWQITYKAENAGKWAIPVNPKGTTINCSGCGAPVRKTLSQRTHICPSCGLILGRDENAARNILRLGQSLAGNPKCVPLSTQIPLSLKCTNIYGSETL